MAHLSGPVLHHDVELGEGSSTQANLKLCIPFKRMPQDVQDLFKQIPALLDPFLLDIILAKPDHRRLFSFSTKGASFTVWANHISLEEEEDRRWAKSKIPVQDQKFHPSCWSITGGEHISEARHIHRIDEEIKLYSGQYLTDFADRSKAMQSFLETKRLHYCYGHPTIKGLEYAMVHGIPRSDDWMHTGCGTAFPSKSHVRLYHVLNDIRSFTDVHKAIRYLKIQPILGSIGIFQPEFRLINDSIYRGPTSSKSKFTGWHATLCDMSFTSIKSESMFIKRSRMNLSPECLDTAVECLGTAVECKKTTRLGVRVHWKGDAATILARCTHYCSKKGYYPMSDTKRQTFKDVIDNMVAKGLICVALAFQRITKIPSQDKRNFGLLAIFGIKSPCPPSEGDEIQVLKNFGEENQEEASRANLVKTTTDRLLLRAFKKYGVTEGIVNEEIGNEVLPQDVMGWSDGDPEYVRLCDETLEESKELPEASDSNDGQMCLGYVSDSDGFNAGKKIKTLHWRACYDFGLCARLGLYCYNFQKGTDYDFGSVRKLYNRDGSFSKSFITLEAVNPSDWSRLTFETCVKHNDGQAAAGVGMWWETCICRLEGSQEADHEWDSEAIDDHYKGEMPQWLSDDDRQRCYVVEESELRHMDSWWLPLFTELAFYTKWNGTLRARDIADYPLLMTQEVVVETRGEAETKPCDKLKAANAIFYISFQCGDDPETGELANYRAVVRKTMDGKPGHMRLEVRCWSI